MTLRDELFLTASPLLAGDRPGAAVREGAAFPGYSTFDDGRGRLEGMLSVNAATGEVWVHTGHGPAPAGQEEATPAASRLSGGVARG